MGIYEILRKTGVLRFGSVKGTYKSGKDIPSELLMDDVYDSKKDLVRKKEHKMPNATQKNTSTKNNTSPTKSKPKWIKYLSIAGVTVVALLVLGTIFGTPSADRVFDESLDKMLQVESVAISQDFSGKTDQMQSIELNSKSYIEMLDNEDLKAKGDFTIDLTANDVPITAEAEYLAVDGGKYIKFSKLTSSNSRYAKVFEPIQNKVKDKWMKARDGDNFANFVDIPIDALTSTTALPFANLDTDVKDEIVKILQDDESFTIVESSKVTVEGKNAYRYELEFDRDKQKEVSDKLNEAVKYFQQGDSNDSTKINKLELWVNIDTKQFIKMEYSGTSDEGDINAIVEFSGYGEKVDVNKPDEYFVESELLD